MDGKKRVIIIGAGAAGLSCAYGLQGSDSIPVLVEAEDCVGGLAKTIFEDGNGTDIGPHRFFTKNETVMNLWKEFLPVQGYPACDDILTGRKFLTEPNGANPEKEDKVFLKRKRYSRIYHKNLFINYPLSLNILSVLPLSKLQTYKVVLSYIKSCFFKLPEDNLEAFMINRFGRILYEMFFEDYTQKVWGVHPSEMPKDWGEQRIRGLSLFEFLRNAFCKFSDYKREVSLISEYLYPKFGAQQLWNAMRDKVLACGGEIMLNSKVTGFNKNGNKIISVKVENTKTGEISEIFGDVFVSSIPVKDLIRGMNDVSENVCEIAENLSYRDYILVNFVTKKINLINNTNYPTVNNIAPDSWIYLQDKGIKAGRFDIINNFSPYIIKDYKNCVVINLEYFCNENDDFWSKNDEDIINFAIDELKKLNIICDEDIIKSKVIRVKKAYPSYVGSYERFDEIKNYIDSLDNLYCIGRNGQHKYNNMDHSILSGITAAEIICGNGDKNMLWNINTNSDYQEMK